MENISKQIYKVHQHYILLIRKVFKGVMFISIPTSIIVYFITQNSLILFIISFIIISIIIYSYYCFFWSKSYFILYNDKIGISVRNGLFSKFDTSINYRNIRDTAYSKNHIFHFILNYGTFFARSSAGGQGDFEAPDIPKVQKIYEYVNFMLSISEIQRFNIIELNDTIISNYFLNNKSDKEIVKFEIENLLNIKGIKQVIQIDENQKKYIFENEEDKNHGIYETIKRKFVLCFTHDGSFRNPDGPIVIKTNSKVIFPPVSFSEIKRRNVVSGSPSLKIHNYLLGFFDNNVDENDATVLVGFDI